MVRSDSTGHPLEAHRELEKVQQVLLQDKEKVPRGKEKMLHQGNQQVLHQRNQTHLLQLLVDPQALLAPLALVDPQALLALQGRKDQPDPMALLVPQGHKDQPDPLALLVPQAPIFTSGCL